MCLNFKCIRIGFQDRRHRLRLRPMYVLFRYGIQTFYTAIIIIIIIIIITNSVRSSRNILVTQRH